METPRQPEPELDPPSLFGPPACRLGSPPIIGFRDKVNLKYNHFDYDKYDIRPGDAKILDENATWLKSNENYLVLIEGHCDQREKKGTPRDNRELGELRATETRRLLAEQGVA